MAKMLEKLTESYKIVEELCNPGNEEKPHGGFCTGYYIEDKNEIINLSYEFPKGTFKIMKRDEDFILWYYNPI